MTIITPFPLLRLPSVATHELLKITDLHEQFQLSLVSTKMKNLVKAFVKRQTISNNLRLIFRDKKCFITFGRSNNHKKVFTVKIKEELELDPSKVKRQFDKVIVSADISCDEKEMYTVTTYWKNRIEGMKTLLSCFLDAFNPNVILLLKEQDKLLASEVLNEFQMSKLYFVSFKCEGSTEDVYQQILRLHCKQLVLHTSPSSNFQYQNSEKPLKFDIISISNAHWVNLDDFLYCKIILLKNTRLQVQDFNRFLKKWLESDSQLEFLSVKPDCPNFRSIFEDIPTNPMKKVYLVGGKLAKFKDGTCFEIQRSNGERALVCQQIGCVFFNRIRIDVNTNEAFSIFNDL